MTPEQFKQARLKLGLTQEKLAKKLNVCEYSVILYETSRVRILPKRINKMMELLKEHSEEKRKKEIELEYLLKN